MSIFNANEKNNSIQCLDKQSATFMWFQLLIDVLMHLPQTENSKNEMLYECRLHYTGNKQQQNKIDDFCNDYESDHAIWWYTLDSFVYRLLNKAFRTGNIDIIFKFRFFIVDLFNRIRESHDEFRKINDIKEITVYRGQEIAATEFSILRENIGKLISMNSFISTTKDRNLALVFAGNGSNRPLFKSILFEMTIVTEHTNIKFADVIFSEEYEVLLTMGAVFRIESIIEQTLDNIWIVKLITSDEQNIQLTELTTYYKEQIGENTSLITFGIFLYYVGQYDKAERYFQIVLDELSSDNEYVASRVYNNLGVICQSKGDYSAGLKFLQKALETRLASQSSKLTSTKFSSTINHMSIFEHLGTTSPMQMPRVVIPLLPLIYHYMSLVNFKEGNYFEALMNSQKKYEVEKYISLNYQPESPSFFLQSHHHDLRTVEFYQNILDKKLLQSTNHYSLSLAQTYITIGEIYSANSNYPESLINYQKALTIQENLLAPDHPDLALTYYNIGSLYIEQDDYMNSLTNYEKALRIQTDVLPRNHPHLIDTYNSIGIAYFKTNDNMRARENFKKALEIAMNLPLSYHSSLGLIYVNIGTAYLNKAEYEQALQYYKKALVIYKIFLPRNHSNVAVVHNNIGSIHLKLANYLDALEHYGKALEIWTNILPKNHPSFVLVHNNIGDVLCKIGDYTQSLINHKRALDIVRLFLPPDHPDVANTLICIGVVQYKHGNVVDALTNFRDALQIEMSTLPENHPSIASTLNSIGLLHSKQGNLIEALDICKKSLEIRTRILPPNHPDIASTYNNIGDIYLKMDDWAMALENFQKALHIETELLSCDHPLLANTLNNLGITYSRKDEPDKALEFYTKALDIYKLSPSHHKYEIATIYSNIGMIHFQNGNYSAALESYEFGRQIELDILPANHPSFVITYTTIGHAHFANGAYEEALTNYEKALDICKGTMPTDQNHLLTLEEAIKEVKSKINYYA
ncbi:unnamed protein product [Rotaria sp. Silwood1]|nr:unnamed protein product [Rotaria sp. Silwood1]CAF1608043.1 unnamed protein product [Rotaria sp. Silwood1]